MHRYQTSFPAAGKSKPKLTPEERQRRRRQSAADRPSRIVRPNEAAYRLGLKRTQFDEVFVKSKRLKKIRIGLRSCGFLKSDIEALIAELAGEGGGE